MKEFLRHAETSFAFNKGRQEIKRILQPFLDKFGFENFYYARIKRNGECIYLTNNVKFAMNYWEEGLPFKTGFDKPSPTIQNLGMTWSHLIDEPTRNFCEYHNCYDGFSFIDRYYDTLKISSFLRSSPDDNSHEFYLNNIQEMRSWVRNFEHKNGQLIEHCLQNPLVLPKSYVIPQKQAFYPKRSINITYNGLTANFSFRELDCLHLLGKGFTIPKIASLLKISPRTVQTHLDAVKNGYGLTTRDDLASFAYTNQLLQTYLPRIVC